MKKLLGLVVLLSFAFYLGCSEPEKKAPVKTGTPPASGTVKTGDVNKTEPKTEDTKKDAK
jgi:hypothetical protein